MKKSNRKLSDEETVDQSMRALADLFDRDAAAIARMRNYCKPEHAPLPIVGELQQTSRELREGK